MLTIRTSAVLAVILAFGMGMSIASHAANAMHTDRLVNHEYRTFI